ncbi:MAG TPA: hypothetical protein VK982_14955 [Bacteroidales bacterium]|nr:hypothetical protein [Bacteroidales bacterium]
MEFKTPFSLKKEHEELHAMLRQAMQLSGKTCEAAKTVAELMHPHFVKEEEYALPPLGLLPLLSSGKLTEEMSDIIIVLIYSGITALTTGLGVIPLYFTSNVSVSKMSLESALGSGLLRTYVEPCLQQASSCFLWVTQTAGWQVCGIIIKFCYTRFHEESSIPIIIGKLSKK